MLDFFDCSRRLLLFRCSLYLFYRGWRGFLDHFSWWLFLQLLDDLLENGLVLLNRGASHDFNEVFKLSLGNFAVAIVIKFLE
jgi:hypothetical protein